MNIMNTALLQSILIAFTLMTACSAKNMDENADSTGGGTEQPQPEPEPVPEADWTVLTKENHPRIFLDDTEFADMKEAVETGQNQYLTKLHEEVMSLADKAGMASSTLTFTLDVSNKRILTVSKNAFVRIFTCAYAYRYTGEEKYLEHAIKDLNDVCSFESWNARKHFLDVGEMAAGVALGYDWLYHELPESTRSLCEKAIQEFAFYPAQNRIWNLNFYTANSNWNQVCNGGLVAAALAIYETCPEQARDIIDKALESNPKVMEALYSPDGNYPEGPGYWGYGTNYEALMLGALETTVGTDFGISRTEGFDRTGMYRLFCNTATDRLFCYGDNMEKAVPEYSMWYLAWKFDDPSLLYKELEFLEKGGYGQGNNEGRFLPMLMAFASRIDMQDIEKPTRKYWCGHGEIPVMMIRTDWTSGESDKYVGFKGGYAQSSHSHMDAGEFYYESEGVRWSMDYQRQSYQSVENAISALGGSFWTMTDGSFRWMVFRMNNRQHSTLTINDEDHLTAGKGTIVEEYSEGSELGAKMDLTPVFESEAESVIRTVKLVDEKDLKITDEIKARDTKDAVVRWTMVTEGEPVVSSNGITLTKNGKTMYLSTIATGTTIRYRQWSSDPSDYNSPLSAYDESNAGTYIVGFEATVSKGKNAIFRVTLSPDK